EYIISIVKRHPIGILRIWGIAIIIVLSMVALFSVFFTQNSGSTVDAAFGADTSNFNAVALGLIALMMILTAVGALVATYVYTNNRFFLTNESVVQEIQNGLFSKHEQTVSLSNIEDASYEQNGLIPTMFNYGRIRLSTEGDETTYRFSYVADPKKHIAILNNAVESFKNGRPVDPNEED
ncbi:MAG TPA: PH domain-containing protein, partial [Candidatus Saccharimonadales bacterium]|nr:PH domain-containing protein [Candidatus Saccharimonadales bacterium]